MLKIVDKNDTSLSLGDRDEPMLAFQGEAGVALRACQLFHNPEEFEQAGNHGLIVKETRLEGKSVCVAVTAHYNGSVEFWLSQPKLLVRNKNGFGDLPITSMNRAEVTQAEKKAAQEVKNIALGVLIEAGLVSAEEAAKGGYTTRRQSSSGWKR